MTEVAALDTQRVGRMGELVVELALLSRGWFVGNFNATTGNSAGWDLFAVRGERSVKLRVKAKRPGVSVFRWSARSDGKVMAGLVEGDRTDFVAAVDFRGVVPYWEYDVFIVPSSLVQSTLADNHAAYLGQPGRGGHQRQDSQQRNLGIDERSDRIGHGYALKWAAYRNAWGILEGE
jgi:hypothetical protein